MQSLQNFLQENTASHVKTESISIYKGAIASPKEIIQAVATIKKAFPGLPAGFYDVLDDRVRANGFTAERLFNAVTHVIDTCIYPQPTIANFISFDKTIKFKTYEQMANEAVTMPEIWSSWLPVKFPEMPKVVWVYANDIVKYGLENYKVEKR